LAEGDSITAGVVRGRLVSRASVVGPVPYSRSEPCRDGNPAHRDEHAEASGGEQGNGERATDRQLAFLRQLASQIRGLGFRRLERWVVDRFAVPLCDLRSRDASGLIDALKTVRAGELRLDDLLGKSAP